MEEGIRYIEQIDRIVAELMAKMPSTTSSEELSLRTLETLGIRTENVPSIVKTSIESHRKR
jgi:hypothetical protein